MSDAPIAPNGHMHPCPQWWDDAEADDGCTCGRVVTAAEDREALARAFADHVAGRRGLEPLNDRAWAVARAAWEDDMEPLLPVVDKIARRRAAEELRELAGSLESRARLFRADAAPLEDAALKARDRADALEAQ
jgi:hypothetical protein